MCGGATKTIDNKLQMTANSRTPLKTLGFYNFRITKHIGKLKKCLKQISKLEALTEHIHPWPGQIITPILPTVKNIESWW